MKIKSVKLKNDYRTEDFVYQKGIPAEIENNDCYRFRKDTGEYLLFYKSDIENNTTDLFEVEYEEERKYIDVRIEYKTKNDQLTQFPFTEANVNDSVNEIYGHYYDLIVTKLGEGKL